MTMQFDLLTIYMVLYGFMMWCMHAVIDAVWEKRLTNKGFLSLPIHMEMGLTMVSLIVILPTLGRNYLGMYMIAVANVTIIRSVLGFCKSRLTQHARWMGAAPAGTWKNLLFLFCTAGALLTMYLVVHPFVMLFCALIAQPVRSMLAIAAWAVIAADFVMVTLAIRTGREKYKQEQAASKARRIDDRIYGAVWNRLEKAYPGIRDEKEREKLVFAKGLSTDKIVWVFLISALLGDLIETLYCRLSGGVWMSRSSVVFGPFSFVWGFGAVLLTLTLHKLAKKNDRWIFLGGAVLGGAFEYMCSVFTELVFGTVFWDYSWMPLNIGGRTNVLYMFFWGLLSVLWIKVLYPLMERLIEGLPVVLAKVCTWLIVALMMLNGMFTMAVMLRCNDRAAGKAPENVLEQFIDRSYNDDFVRQRWRNMVKIVIEDGE